MTEDEFWANPWKICATPAYIGLSPGAKELFNAFLQGVLYLRRKKIEAGEQPDNTAPFTWSAMIMRPPFTNKRQWHDNAAEIKAADLAFRPGKGQRDYKPNHNPSIRFTNAQLNKIHRNEFEATKSVVHGRLGGKHIGLTTIRLFGPDGYIEEIPRPASIDEILLPEDGSPSPKPPRRTRAPKDSLSQNQESHFPRNQESDDRESEGQNGGIDAQEDSRFAPNNHSLSRNPGKSLSQKPRKSLSQKPGHTLLGSVNSSEYSSNVPFPPAPLPPWNQDGGRASDRAQTHSQTGETAIEANALPPSGGLGPSDGGLGVNGALGLRPGKDSPQRPEGPVPAPVGASGAAREASRLIRRYSDPARLWGEAMRLGELVVVAIECELGISPGRSFYTDYLEAGGTPWGPRMAAFYRDYAIEADYPIPPEIKALAAEYIPDVVLLDNIVAFGAQAAPPPEDIDPDEPKAPADPDVVAELASRWRKGDA